MKHSDASEPAHDGAAYSAMALFPIQEACEAPIEQGTPSWLPWWLNPFAWALLTFIALYRALVPIEWRRRCIYEPSCSAFGMAAIKKYGALVGGLRLAQRIHRCNGAAYRGGSDPP
jgi:putative membrane protein insertion efficiency factor